MEMPLVATACALVAHCASLFGWLFIIRVGSWQERQSWPLELSRTRKFGDTVSVDCTCAWWQLVHSTLPLISATVCVWSRVRPPATIEAAKSGESFSGIIRLVGWEPWKLVPKISPDFIEPLIAMEP